LSLKSKVKGRKSQANDFRLLTFDQ
jgi:hypothetical protein